MGSNGDSLIEVIIAATVGILVVTALTFATIFSLRNANFAKSSAQATKLAQDGIEIVRGGRDRNACIVNLNGSVNSWNDGNSACSGSGSIWAYRITGTSENCENTTSGSKCYFTVSPTGVLTHIYSSTSFPTSFYEGIPSSVNPLFKRVVLLSDDAHYASQKKVTVIVRWSDATGDHESKLTTILRKL